MKTIAVMFLSLALSLAAFGQQTIASQTPPFYTVSEHHEYLPEAEPQSPTPTPAPVTPPTPNPSTNLTNFTLTASVVSLPGAGTTFPATDVGGTFAVTNNFLLRADNIVAPGPNLTANYGGVQYALPLMKVLKNTNLNSNSFQFYITASAGESRVAAGSGRFSALLGGGVNYSPSANGHFTTNLAEIRWAKFPGFTNSTAVFSSSLNWTF